MIGVFVWWTMAAMANDGPSPSIAGLQQEGQDVVVTLWLADIGEPGFGQSVSVERDGQHVAAGTFALSEAREVEARCWSSGDVERCGDPGVDCLDCDGDGSMDCAPDEYRAAQCYQSGLVDLVDGCVPPGEHAWTTDGFEEEGGQPSTLDVAAVDVSCLPDGWDDPDDPDDPEAEGSSGCSATGTPLVAWGTGLGLLALGLLGLRRRRE